MVTTNIIFDHHGKARTNKDLVQLEIRITVDRQSYYIPTGIKITKKQWSVNRIENRPDADALNDRLAVIAHAAYDEVTACIKQGREIVASEIRKLAENTKESTKRIKDIKLYDTEAGYQLNLYCTSYIPEGDMFTRRFFYFWGLFPKLNNKNITTQIRLE